MTPHQTSFVGMMRVLAPYALAAMIQDPSVPEPLKERIRRLQRCDSRHPDLLFSLINQIRDGTIPIVKNLPHDRVLEQALNEAGGWPSSDHMESVQHQLDQILTILKTPAGKHKVVKIEPLEPRVDTTIEPLDENADLRRKIDQNDRELIQKLSRKYGSAHKLAIVAKDTGGPDVEGQTWFNWGRGKNQTPSNRASKVFAWLDQVRSGKISILTT